MRDMKLKYYLRGLGIGVLVTALILGIADKGEEPLTDAQIRERAIELGMVDSDSLVLSELRENGTKEAMEESSDKVPEREPAAEVSAEESAAEEQAAEGIPSEETAECVIIEIQNGVSSYTVSRDLQEAGLIADAGEFDNYLCDNGYSRVLRVGTYEIPVGTKEEEIAQIITGKR